MGLSPKPDSAAFSLAQATIPLEASTWQTEAPASAQARVAPPVYANRLSTFTGRFAARIFPGHKVPVYRLLRKQSRMFKSGRANLKGQPPYRIFSILFDPRFDFASGRRPH